MERISRITATIPAASPNPINPANPVNPSSDNHPIMQNPPANPKRPRFFKRALALLIVLGAGVWGAAYQARPKPPFRFLEGFDLAGRPTDFAGVDGNSTCNFYCAVYYKQTDYGQLCALAKKELQRDGWVPDSKNGEVRSRFASGKLPPKASKLEIHPDSKMRIEPSDGNVRAEEAAGWTSVIYSVKYKPSGLDIILSHVRAALHL